MTIKERLHAVGMALFGPAPSGPYGPPVPPPPPRPRSKSGRLLHGRKLAEFHRLANAARALAERGMESF